MSKKFPGKPFGGPSREFCPDNEIRFNLPV
jgi:hypothetical protein